MSGDPSTPTPTRLLLPRLTIGLSLVAILGSPLLGVFLNLGLGVICLVLGMISFRSLRSDPSAQGTARAAVATALVAFLIGVGWMLIALVVSGLPALGG
jgi:hypothetical protein